MPLPKIIACLLIGMILFRGNSYGQSIDSAAGKIANFPSRFLSRIQGKTAGLDKQLTRQTEKYLQKMATQEAALKKKLGKLDSTAAKNLFTDEAAKQYGVLAQKIKNDTAGRSPATGAYLPYADSLQAGLGFLKSQSLPGSSADMQARIRSSISQMNQLQSKMQDADQIKQFVQQRRDQIRAYLNQYTNLPGDLTNAYQGYSKEFYYYSQQVTTYKELLNDPDKLEKKALTILDQLPAFKDFMAKNSQLAMLFGTPAGYGTPQSIAGLPTQTQVQDLLRSQMGGGADAQAAMAQNVQTAESALDDLKSKLSKYGQGGGDVDIPDFKPNNQKTRTFLQRLELGTNIQTLQGNNYFPTTTDLGLSLGYKLSDKNTIGVGASYKLGWGSGIQHIALSSQGLGLRSFVDIRLKGSLSVTGGFEYNYQQPYSGLLPPAQGLPASTGWQKSGLLGLSKTVSVKSKVFKKTQLQLLWDFLSYEQVPQTEPLLFRVGYNF